MNKFEKIWWCVWGVFIALALAHYGYAVWIGASPDIIRVEHQYYIGLLLLAGISCFRIPCLKPILWVVVFLNFSLHALPELEEIFILSECGEGKCHVAVEKGYVKMYDDHWEYIPKKDRLGAN